MNPASAEPNLMASTHHADVFAKVKSGGLLHDIRSIDAATETGNGSWTNEICMAQHELVDSKRRRSRVQREDVLSIKLTCLVQARQVEPAEQGVFLVHLVIDSRGNRYSLFLLIFA